MRLRNLVLLVMLAAAASVASCGVRPTPRSSPSVQDGPASMASWEGVPWRDEFAEPEAPAQSPPPTRMQVTGADGALRVRTECEGALESDAIDVVVDAVGDRLRTWRYTLLPDGTCTEGAADQGGELPSAACDPTIRHFSSLHDGLWRAELALPYARVGATPEWIWRVTRTRSRDDRTHRLVWTPRDPVVHLPAGQPVVSLRAGPRTLDWHVSQARVAMSCDAQGQYTFWPSARLTSLSTLPLRVSLGAGPEPAGPAGAATETELLPGSSVDVVLPSFTSRRNALDDKVYVSAREPRAPEDVSSVGAWLTGHRHVGLRVLEPAYRGNVYATQDVSTLVFGATLSATTASLATDIDVQLADGAGNVVRSVRMPALAELTGKLEIRSLAEGTYTLAARALRADGHLLGEDRVLVRKLGKPRGSEVRIDDRGNIVVDGHPRLLVGWYGDPPWDDPRPEVLALQNVRTATILSTPDPRPIREAFARGVYSIVSVDPFRVRGISGAGPERTAVMDEIRTTGQPSLASVTSLAKLVEAIRDEPGLLGYYLADEPEIAGYRSDYLERAYAQLAELDPYHPIVITNMATGGLATHGVRAADILNPDPYSPHPDEVPAFMRAAHRLMHPGQTLMTTLWQASWKRHYEYLDRDPNPFEVTRAQYLSAVALGARGFTGYIAAFFMPEPVLRYGLPSIWRELRFLEPAVAAPAPEVSPAVEGPGQVYAWIRSVGGEVYVIASNPEDKPTAATLRHPLLRELREIAVVGENRTVSIEQGALRDTFSGGAVHVYATSDAGRALPSIAATEAEITARRVSGAAPGNVLHESQGTRVYSVKGSVPPFPRFFEYVVNGVKDDEGWHVPTIGPVRPWFEVALPTPKSIGHIAVYTPNLRDFDLEIMDDRGVRHFAEIRGNIKAEVHVPVRPAVMAVKVRLTAVACRPDATPTGPTVREIEAFSSGPPGPGATWVTSSRDLPTEPGTRPLSYSQPVWEERFSGYSHALAGANVASGGWAFDPAAVTIVPRGKGGIVVSSTSAAGYASLSRNFAYPERGRYFQARIGSVEGEGYRFFSIALGAGGARWTPLVSHRPGLYTIDLHALRPALTDGKTDQLLASIQLAGSAPIPGGGVRPGPRVTFEWLRLTADPIDALTVSASDGSPLPERLRDGDEVVFRVTLQRPANDVVVECRVNPDFSVLTLNGSPYVQMKRAGTGDGRQWVARVTLGPGSDRFDGTKGFPVVARAVLSGGPLRETSTMVVARFE